MRNGRNFSRAAKGLLCAAALAALFPRVAAAQDGRPQCATENQDPLEGRNCAFLKAGARRTEFLPSAGSFTYLSASHSPGRTSVGTWRFTAADVPRAGDPGGPLSGVFAILVEGQPVGRLAHQVLHRGTAWRRVHGTRFVPPGAPASSAVFVEWRREGNAWVVSAVGDEAFLDGAPLPPWCC